MAVDVERYCRRIGYTGPREPTLDTLRALHVLHPAAIPFENLTTLLGRTPALDLESLEAKMLDAGRGGYCFEHNRLFAAVLAALGFEVASLAARVLFKRVDDSVPPRSHMLLAVRHEGGAHIADVGFGGLTLTAPLRLAAGLEQATPHERFRLLERDGGFVLQAEVDEAWQALYWFDLHEHLDVDFDVLNHFVATHPASPFTTTLMAARALADRRLGLRGNRYSVYRLGGRTERRELASAAALGAVLGEDFGIELPEEPGMERVLEEAAGRKTALEA
jgi:N-hydroxyarylamine O-acetyltransferase